MSSLALALTHSPSARRRRRRHRPLGTVGTAEKHRRRFHLFFNCFFFVLFVFRIIMRCRCASCHGWLHFVCFLMLLPLRTGLRGSQEMRMKKKRSEREKCVYVCSIHYIDGSLSPLSKRSLNDWLYLRKKHARRTTRKTKGCAIMIDVIMSCTNMRGRALRHLHRIQFSHTTKMDKSMCGAQTYWNSTLQFWPIR